jgi:hypothetical protein
VVAWRWHRVSPMPGVRPNATDRVDPAVAAPTVKPNAGEIWPIQPHTSDQPLATCERPSVCSLEWDLSSCPPGRESHLGWTDFRPGAHVRDQPGEQSPRACGRHEVFRVARPSDLNPARVSFPVGSDTIRLRTQASLPCSQDAHSAGSRRDGCFGSGWRRLLSRANSMYRAILVASKPAPPSLLRPSLVN